MVLPNLEDHRPAFQLDARVALSSFERGLIC
jgi:hypothetical protein